MKDQNLVGPGDPLIQGLSSPDPHCSHWSHSMISKVYGCSGHEDKSAEGSGEDNKVDGDSAI